jgi:YegS/Rv2252/BmrU family lipid kinase
MKRKTAYLIINPRSDKIDKLTAMISVLSAAGWKTDTAIKEYGGHTQRLAKKAAEAGYDLVIGYGGDGTINQVVNGVVAAKRRRCVVGVIPGGTANVWAHEIGMTEDAVKAALVLINSEGRKVDLGHVQVDSLPISRRTTSQRKKPPLASGGRHHFLLMAGLGIDAAILRGVSTPLKEKIGEAAVAVAAVAVVPAQHTFPIEIRASGAGKKKAVHWKGEALQVIVGNTRRYGNIAEVTPDAYIDDGVLDVCVITAGDPLSTMQQILSVLLRRDPVHGRSEYFQSAQVEISVPASIDLQLDGSPVKRKDYQTAPTRTTRKNGAGAQPVMVTYRFDAMPRALQVAVPRAYGGALFEGGSGNGAAPPAEMPHPEHGAAPAKARRSGRASHHSAEQINALLEHGRKVTVVAVGPNPERRGTYVVAGAASAKKTGESKPVAVRIDRTTTLVTSAGESLPTAFAATLPDGGVIVVEGKQSKRGVIHAKRVVVMQ